MGLGSMQPNVVYQEASRLDNIIPDKIKLDALASTVTGQLTGTQSPAVQKIESQPLRDPTGRTAGEKSNNTLVSQNKDMEIRLRKRLQSEMQ